MKVVPFYTIALNISFLVLEVAGKIDWPWWQVTMPLLIGSLLATLTAILTASTDSANNKKK